MRKEDGPADGSSSLLSSGASENRGCLEGSSFPIILFDSTGQRLGPIR